MDKYQLVSEDYLKDSGIFPSNLDVKDYVAQIQPAQDFYIRDILGDSLFERLTTVIKAFVDNSTAIPTNDLALLNLIRPCLAYYIAYDSVTFLASKIRNIGIVETADEKQRNVGNTQLAKMETKFLSRALYYKQRIVSYLCKNSDKFTEYQITGQDVDPNKTSSYTSEIWIDTDFVDEKFVKKYIRE